MCPPAQPPPPEIDLYWSDEQIISLLSEYTPGSHLPNNVLADSSPYQYPPSNLPEGIWYLVPSNEKKEYVHGFWKANGGACKIYSNSTINGWRNTLRYFQGQAPHGRSTDWLMQEYGITQKELCDKDMPKDSRLLCRVFLCSEHSSKSETNLQICETTIIESKKINSVASFNPNNDITSGHDSGCESKAKRECEVGTSPLVADNKSNSSQQVFSELECFLRGDYLELNDLEDPESHSSSSRNSSCVSKLSDEDFDVSAFLRDLEEDENNYVQGQQSSSRYNFTSVRPSDVVLQPASSGSLLTTSVRTDVVEGSGSSSTIHERSADKRLQESTAKRHNPESRSEGTSNAVPSGEKKASAGRMKKLKIYLCFRPF